DDVPPVASWRHGPIMCDERHEVAVDRARPPRGVPLAIIEVTSEMDIGKDEKALDRRIHACKRDVCEAERQSSFRQRTVMTTQPHGDPATDAYRRPRRGAQSPRRPRGSLLPAAR